jgi:transposase
VPPAREGHRRTFSEADKRRIVEETARPGASLSEIARSYGIAARVLFRWKLELTQAAPLFVAVEITDAIPPTRSMHHDAASSGREGSPRVRLHRHAQGHRRACYAMLVQGVLRQDPFSGHLFLFRGRKANLIKIVFWDGTGLCLFTKRLEHGVFLWPSNVEPGGTLMLTSAQLSMLIDGVDWRAPERQWRPAVAG